MTPNELAAYDAMIADRDRWRERAERRSPSLEVDNAPDQWRSQCLVARIQRDESLKSAEHAKAYKRVMKLEHQKMKRQLAAALEAISAIEERYIDGCDTYEDWKFMGDTARAFLEEIV